MYEWFWITAPLMISWITLWEILILYCAWHCFTLLQTPTQTPTPTSVRGRQRKRTHRSDSTLGDFNHRQRRDSSYVSGSIHMDTFPFDDTLDATSPWTDMSFEDSPFGESPLGHSPLGQSSPGHSPGHSPLGDSLGHSLGNSPLGHSLGHSPLGQMHYGSRMPGEIPPASYTFIPESPDAQGPPEDSIYAIPFSSLLSKGDSCSFVDLEKFVTVNHWRESVDVEPPTPSVDDPLGETPLNTFLQQDLPLEQDTTRDEPDSTRQDSVSLTDWSSSPIHLRQRNVQNQDSGSDGSL